MKTKTRRGRLAAPLLIVCAWALLSSASQAQSDVTPPSPAQSLSCLQRPAEPPRYPERSEFDKGQGFMRVLLKFDAPDRAPQVEVLSNTARQDMQDRAFRHLREYRLPCLQPRDGTVSAVQEFRFNNSDMAPLSLPDDRPAEARQDFCIVMPRKDVRPPTLRGDAVEHVVAVAIFNGDGQQPPEVKFLHSSAQPGFEKIVRARMADYRMPCRTGSEPPQLMRQQFSFRPDGVSSFMIKRESLGLLEFLAMSQGRESLEADFDFGSMGCPFKVNYTIYGPNLPNEVRAGGRRDPNKLPFLRWLAQRQMAFVSPRQANDLFGSTLQLNVPCGVLKLPLEKAASPT